MFSAKGKKVWTEIAEDIGAHVESKGRWGSTVLRYQSGEWEITLDTYVVTTGQTTMVFTRMRAPYVNKDGLKFKIYREGFFGKIGKFFGSQDLEIGDPDFDKKFIIKGNNVDTIRELLEAPGLKKMLDNEPHIHLEVKDDEGWFGTKFPDGVDELYFQCGGILHDADRIKNLFAIFCVTLDRLVQIESAEEGGPDVKLK